MFINRRTHIYKNQAQLPTPIEIDNLIYVFYSHRVKNLSHIGLIVLNDCFQVIKDFKSIMRPGNKGCFDDSGVMPSCAVKKDNKIHLYFTGWNTDKGKASYGHGIGLATFDKNKFKLKRNFIGPILDRTEKTPYLVNSPFITENEMYFCNGSGWEGNFATYNISKCIRKNGNWFYKEKILGQKGEANSRPFVLKHENNTHIWTACKTKKSVYKIKYFINTKLINDDFIPKSNKGWDSEMICYPYFLNYKSKKYIFYNGNNYGQTGFGIGEIHECDIPLLW